MAQDAAPRPTTDQWHWREFLLGSVVGPIVAAVVGGVILAVILDRGPFSGSTTAPNRPPETDVIRFDAYEADGLTPAFDVTETGDAECFTDSTVLLRLDARRCFRRRGAEIDLILDPCFQTLPPLVACVRAPWVRSGALLIVVEDLGPLAPEQQLVPGSNGPSEPNEVWAVRLLNGKRCVADTGGVAIPRGGLIPFLDCDGGGVVVGALERSDDLWRATFFDDDQSLGKEIGVVTAWL